MAILNFSDILQKVGLDPAKVKLIRHSLSDREFRECAEQGMVYAYTCHQKPGFSKGYDYWAVFISGESTLAKFYALYRVGDAVPDTPDVVPQGLPAIAAKGFRGEIAYFQLTPVELLREYEGKLTIDWGGSTRMWHQKGTTEKPVVSLQPDEKMVFSGFENLVLSFDKLKEVFDNETVYNAWHDAFKSVYAIYLIVDRESGKQYVGSAYGEGGLHGRWASYVQTHHGNNKRMRELLRQYPERYHSFQFSILQILPKTVMEKDVLEIENRYKRKLLSIEFGLNDN